MEICSVCRVDKLLTKYYTVECKDCKERHNIVRCVSSCGSTSQSSTNDALLYIFADKVHTLAKEYDVANCKSNDVVSCRIEPHNVTHDYAHDQLDSAIKELNSNVAQQQQRILSLEQRLAQCILCVVVVLIVFAFML